MSNTELVCFFSSLKKGRRLFSEPRQEWDGLAPDFIKDALKIYKDEIDRRRASGQLTLKMVRSILHPIEQRKRAERAMGNIIKIASSTPKKSGGAFS